MPKRWIAGGLTALALWPAAAAASGPSGIYARVLHAYQTTGSVPPCQFSSQQLSAAKASVDTYGQQYYADFIAAIQGALTQQATGFCSKHHPAVSSASAGTLPAGPPPPASVTAASSSGLPAPLIVLGILALFGALVAVLASLADRPGGAAEWRHSWEEARYRAGLWGTRAGRGRR